MNKYTHIMITFTFRCYLITSGNYIMNTIPFLATTIIPDTVLPQGHKNGLDAFLNVAGRQGKTAASPSSCPIFA